MPSRQKIVERLSLDKLGPAPNPSTVTSLWMSNFERSLQGNNCFLIAKARYSKKQTINDHQLRDSADHRAGPERALPRVRDQQLVRLLLDKGILCAGDCDGESAVLPRDLKVFDGLRGRTGMGKSHGDGLATSQ